MTDFYDVEKTITSLGTGEALVTVLSPRGVPTPLARDPAAPARLADGADRRGPVPRAASRRARSRPSTATTVDRDSAYERITARLAAARQAAVDAAVRAGVDPTTATGMNTMTPGPAAARDRAAAEGDRGRPGKAASARRSGSARPRRRPQRAAAKAQQKTIDTAIRTGGKVVTSRLGQDIIRGVFGTLFGGGKSK